MNRKNENYYSKLASDVRKILQNKKFPSNDDLYTDLLLCEESWKELFLSTQHGHDIYEQFIDFIIDVKKNILDSRPYFRIRQKEFIDKVNPHLRTKKYKPLTKLRINTLFITWAMERYTGPHKVSLDVMVNKINQLRNDFIIRNFPLILNRIKLIYHTSQLEMQDLISLSSNAALIALDKFAPTINEDGNIVYTSVLLSSIIARINAAVTQSIDSQQLHLYPSDRKVLIEIAKLRKEGLNETEISKKMSMPEYEVSRFINGVFIDNIDDNMDMSEPDGNMPDENVSLEEQKQLLFKNLDTLSVLEKKILMLKNLIS